MIVSEYELFVFVITCEQSSLSACDGELDMHGIDEVQCVDEGE